MTESALEHWKLALLIVAAVAILTSTVGVHLIDRKLAVMRSEKQQQKDQFRAFLDSMSDVAVSVFWIEMEAGGKPPADSKPAISDSEIDTALVADMRSKCGEPDQAAVKRSPDCLAAESLLEQWRTGHHLYRVLIPEGFGQCEMHLEFIGWTLRVTALKQTFTHPSEQRVLPLEYVRLIMDTRNDQWEVVTEHALVSGRKVIFPRGNDVSQRVGDSISGRHLQLHKAYFKFPDRPPAQASIPKDLQIPLQISFYDKETGRLHRLNYELRPVLRQDTGEIELRDHRLP